MPCDLAYFSHPPLWLHPPQLLSGHKGPGGWLFGAFPFFSSRKLSNSILAGEAPPRGPHLKKNTKTGTSRCISYTSGNLETPGCGRLDFSVLSFWGLTFPLAPKMDSKPFFWLPPSPSLHRVGEINFLRSHGQYMYLSRVRRNCLVSVLMERTSIDEPGRWLSAGLESPASGTREAEHPLGREPELLPHPLEEINSTPFQGQRGLASTGLSHFHM